jgi:protein SCO1
VNAARPRAGFLRLAAVWALVLGAFARGAVAAEAVPFPLREVGVVEHLGDTVPLHLPFRDQAGQKVTLGDVLADGKPVLLTLNYYNCATLCGIHLNALLSGLRDLDWVPGDQFHVVTVSIDPSEGPPLAAAKRSTFLNALGKGDVDWRFLVGVDGSEAELARAVGFEYRYDEDTKQWAHAAVLTFLSPTGVVSRYLYGLDLNARDIKFSLMESAAGRLGSPVERVVLSCFRFDASTGRYTAEAFGIMRLGGLLTIASLSIFSFVLWRKDRTSPSLGSPS